MLGCRYCHLYSSVISLSLTQLQSDTPPSLSLSVFLSLLLIQSSMKVQRVPGDCSNSQKDEEREGEEREGKVMKMSKVGNSTVHV